MRLYLDSSAIVKLVREEDESDALRRYLRRCATDGRSTSAFARVEVVRAVYESGVDAITHARRQLARVDILTLDQEVLDDAATLAPGSGLRSLDAIHLASARSIGADMRAIVTYDRRMQDAAGALGLPIEAPA